MPIVLLLLQYVHMHTKLQTHAIDSPKPQQLSTVPTLTNAGLMHGAQEPLRMCWQLGLACLFGIRISSHTPPLVGQFGSGI